MPNQIRNLTIIVVAILLIPLIAMQFTDEVNWTLFDFLMMGGMLFGTGLLIQLIREKVKSKTYRWILIALLLIGFLLVWAALAVGVFGL